ncbi:hypothetical protein [Paraflavitalea pollutisoli]|uniref:hypothetical protein n=1 Tax=Paraflavitalea pollutisoli TaxID=3034143 RepID=UPI0023EC6234|nr:hypothetical protein [Paraflavitalea sp. H1-2-19X]
MLPLLKIFLFPVLGAAVILLGVHVYHFFNEKIIGSRTLGALVGYTLLMIAANIGLVALGVLMLMKVYALLSSNIPIFTPSPA